ncbi:MAG: Rieske 2Fe-2S domain-containing protein [Candidatus Aminicenantes bacterium]|nr:Rieske 2Fe-2S domain-containing protein [Candidatus Aminicenantes bacterium]
MKYSRREFLKVSGTTIACTCLGGVCLSGCSAFSGVSSTPLAPSGSYRKELGRLVVELEKIEELKRVGGSVKLSIHNPEKGEDIKIILIHPENKTYLAFSDRCTHRGKELEFVHPEKKLRCASRHSEYDLSGQVLKGNAEEPVPVYATELDGSKLIVNL